MLRCVPALASHIDKDAGVHGHHDEESQQVESCPENQEASAVNGRHSGTVEQITLAVPDGRGHQAHDDAHCPNAQDEQPDAPPGHGAVQLHGDDGLVAFHGHGQQAGHRGRQADVDQGSADVPLLLCERACPGARVQHQVGIGNPCKQVCCSHVAKEIVDGEVEAAIREDGHHHHYVGQGHDDTHCQSQSNHHKVPRRPQRPDLFTHQIVEERDIAGVVAGAP